MILRLAALAGLMSALQRVSADVAPEITTLAEGYNYIAKLPCVNCPYLYQDTSGGEDGPWIDRVDDNALLLNISLPYTTPDLSINSAPVLSSTLPPIHATQVLLDYPTASLASAITHNTLSTTGPLLGLSYGTSLHRVKNSTAQILRFNIFALHFPLTTPPLTHPLDASAQKVLELILLPRPLPSPADTNHGWEIISARLRAREAKGSKHPMRIMAFEEWDEFGHKGGPKHLISSSGSGVVRYAASGFWGLSVVLLSGMVVFVAVVVGCVLGWERYGDEVEKANGGKRRGGSKGSGSWMDVEKAKGRFLSAGELGVGGTGSVVGVGKSD